MAESSENRRLEPGKLVLASHNKGKLVEINDMLAPHGFEVLSAGDLDLPEPVEDGDTFEANAAIKALAAAKATNLPALADDSGFCVNGLNGDPGIYSARWAGPGKDFGVAMEAVHTKLQENGSSDKNRLLCCGAMPCMAGWAYPVLSRRSERRAGMATTRHGRVRLRSYVCAGWRNPYLW